MYHACIYPTRTLCMCVYTLISLLLALKQPTERTPIPYHYIGYSQSFTARINAIGANILVTKSLSIFLTIQHIPLEVKFCGEISFCSFIVYCDIFYFWSYMQNTTLSLFFFFEPRKSKASKNWFKTQNCSSPQKSLVKGERFIRSEEKPEHTFIIFNLSSFVSDVVKILFGHLHLLPWTFCPFFYWKIFPDLFLF